MSEQDLLQEQECVLSIEGERVEEAGDGGTNVEGASGALSTIFRG